VVPDKDALAAYWRRVAGRALPYLARRPLKLVRHSHGTTFYHKGQLPPIPPAVHQLRIEKREGGQGTRLWVDSLDGLLGLVEIGVVEVHPWNATVEDIERPDRLVFDLDPGAPSGLREACVVAGWLREALELQGLTAFPKTSGVKGLHVYVPLHSAVTFAETKAYARTMASFLAREHADLVVDRQTRSLRAGKVLVDWLQNDAFRSTVAPYSIRATETPRVSTPVGWHEIGDVAEGRAGEDALAFGVEDVLARLAREGDRFAPVLSVRQQLLVT
jgi:bifunctional non-homologous end joining protein LigD